MNRVINPFSLRGFMALALLVPLVVGTLHPDIRIPVHMPAIYRIDLGVHWTAFFMVAAALLMLLPHRQSRVLIICLALAVLLEAFQLFIDGRQADITDMFANLIGVACAFVLVKSLKMPGGMKPAPERPVSPLP